MTRQKSLINSDGNSHWAPPTPQPADGGPGPRVSSMWGLTSGLLCCCSAIPGKWLPCTFQLAAQVPAITSGPQPARRGDDVHPASLLLVGLRHGATLAARLRQGLSTAGGHCCGPRLQCYPGLSLCPPGLSAQPQVVTAATPRLSQVSVLASHYCSQERHQA